jgi:4-amino-4-deoxy-L-arabinose transferase-like glycosyltransferase
MTMKKIKIGKVLLPLLLISLFLIFLNYLYTSTLILFYPYEVEYSEGFELYNAIRIYEGENLYKDIHSEPKFLTVDYPPIFYYIGAILIPIFGETLIGGRVISLLSSLLIVILIFKIVHKETKSKKLSLISSLLFFSSYTVFFWSVLYRNLMLPILFSLLGVYFILDYKKTKRLILAVTFFLLALYTKQTAIIASVAVFLFLFLKDRKTAFKFLSLLSVPALGIFLLINYLTDNQFFLHTFEYNLSFSTSHLELIYWFILFHMFTFVFSFLYSLKNKEKLLSLYFFISLLFVIFYNLKPEGWFNYFIEAIPVMCILTGIFLGNLHKKYFNLALFLLLIQIFLALSPLPRAHFLLSALLIQGLIFWYRTNLKVRLGLLCILFIFLFQFQIPKFPSYTRSDDFSLNGELFFLKNTETDETISTYVKSKSGKILIEHAYFPILYKKWVPPDISGIYELQQIGILDRKEFVEYCLKSNFSMIIYYYRLDLIDGFKECIKNYKLVKTLPWLDIDYEEWNWKIYERI